ncbi:MAG: hypothetical protein QMD94_04745 [Candidatus Omnitrophota bacterium]|nr:hypothetical protein [Candidatus Omnitrophota bacterium]
MAAEEVKQEVKQEEKQEEKKAEAGKFIATVFKFLLGFVFLILGISAIIVWWSSLVGVVKGCIGLFLLLAALITFAIAKE